MIQTCKINLLFLLVLLAASSVQAQRRALKESELIGKFSSSYSTITVEATGNYHENWGDCTTESYESGKYSYSEGVLFLAATKRGVRNRGEKRWRNLFDRDVYQKFNGDDPPRATRRGFLPITWGERLYLMEKEDLIDFTNVINFGIEPRAETGCVWPVVGAFYLREGDGNKTATGYPSLSEDLVSMILKTPIEAQIVGIEGEGDEKIAILNQ